MAENVRIAVNAGIKAISWPTRCPRCGGKEKLISVDSRVVRLSAEAPTKLGAMLAIRSETVHLSFGTSRALLRTVVSGWCFTMGVSPSRFGGRRIAGRG